MLELSAPWPEAAAQPEVFSLRAQAFIQVEDWKQARTALREGMTRFPGQDLFQRAAELPPKLFDEGRFFKSDSRRALAQLNLESMAGLWAEFRSWDRCLATVLEARKAAPVRDVELLLLQATALESLGRPDQAIAVLREGQKLSPNHPTLQNNLGFSLLERGGDLDEAARLIRSALDKEPKNGSTMDSWGWVLFKQGKFAEAEAALRKAAEESPFSPEVHRHLGEALLKLDRLQDALDEWDRALAFAFPQRKQLEDMAQSLRTRLAKSRTGGEEPDAGPRPDDGPEETADDEEAD
jgi:tetratricopeptide (TPR) repeat protein